MVAGFKCTLEERIEACRRVLREGRAYAERSGLDECWCSVCDLARHELARLTVREEEPYEVPADDRTGKAADRGAAAI